MTDADRPRCLSSPRPKRHLFLFVREASLGRRVGAIVGLREGESTRGCRKLAQRVATAWPRECLRALALC